MKLFKLSAFAVCFWGALALVTSCGGHSTADGTDSNTHWLRDCDSDSDCGSLSCVCGVCTAPCSDGSDCAPFGASATCAVPRGCSSPSAPSACVRASDGGGGSSSGDSSSDGGGGGSTIAPDPECPAMDARTGQLNCGEVVGYAYDGKVCAPVFCSCEGSECGALFATADECDSAYQACYAKRGVLRSCVTHSECRIQYRTCCPGCDTPGVASFMATTMPSAALDQAGICIGDPTGPCNNCLPGQNPALYSACIEGECRMVDLSEQAACKTSADCQLLSKNCCDCPEDSRTDLVSVNKSTTSLPFCPALGCEACVYEPDRQVGSTCNAELGKCGMFVTTL